MTKNLRRFRKEQLSPLGLHAESPDDFILQLFDYAPEEDCRAISIVRTRLRNPPFTVHELLNLLSK